MKLLLDTHFVVWLTQAPDRLRPREITLLQEPNVEICVSALTIWELRLKWAKRHPSGARKGELDAVAALAFLRGAGWELVDLSVTDAAAELNHPVWHKDPFDEQLLIQAQRLGARLLTRDEHLQDHPLAWRFT